MFVAFVIGCFLIIAGGVAVAVLAALHDNDQPHAH